MFMKKNLRPLFLLSGMIFLASFAYSQSDRFAYTVTDSVQAGVRWSYLRKIDLRSGTFSEILLRLINRNDTVPNSLLQNGVAAMALDDKSKRLYYTPLFTDRLSYVDLKTMRIITVTNNFTGLMPKAADQGNVITRMVIVDEENGYALTNDGNHLVRFNVKNNRVRDLGSLIDANNNNGVSVHEVCSSFGGDIIAGDDNNILYLVTSRNHVFKINIITRVARYLGTINDLPEDFITSGVAADYRGNNRFVLGSSVHASLYSVNLRTLSANELATNNPWKVADLANNSNLKANKEDDREDPDYFVSNTGNVKSISIYPNPVTSNEFKIQFSATVTDNYVVQVIDALGQTIVKKNLNTGGKTNVYTIDLPESTSKGIYVVRIADKANKPVYSEKIIVQ